MSISKDLVYEIDQLLPQAQCGLCNFGACRPYAEAIAFHDENINRCPPGGVKTLQALASLLKKDASPFLKEMENKQKPPSVAVIREAECIGCTKCIQACPVDAILGTAKKMHTVISDECTGCELCIKPCPVDCIDMLSFPPLSDNLQKEKAARARRRYQAKQKRITIKNQEAEFAKLSIDLKKAESVAFRKAAILDAIDRTQAKKKDVRDQPPG
jgi:electron transport complex protein RnfB